MMASNNNVRVPKDDKALGDYFPSRFIKVQDLLNWGKAQLEVTISRATEELVEPRPGEKEWKLVLYFVDKHGNEYPRGYLVSAKADIDTLAEMGVEKVGDLKDVRVLIKVDQWRNKSVLRLADVMDGKFEEID